VIADGAQEFARGIDALLETPTLPLREIDAFLDTQSWDETWEHMRRLVEDVSGRDGQPKRTYTDRVIELRDVDAVDGHDGSVLDAVDPGIVVGRAARVPRRCSRARR
jgi:hypothetical protein